MFCLASTRLTCLRSHHGVEKPGLVYVVMKTITVQTYGDYTKYGTHHDKLINRILNLPPDKNKVLFGVHSVKEHMTEYEIDNRSVYEILDQICKDTDLYKYINQHKSLRDRREAFYTIQSRWLGLNHVNTKASEAAVLL